MSDVNLFIQRDIFNTLQCTFRTGFYETIVDKTCGN